MCLVCFFLSCLRTPYVFLMFFFLSGRTYDNPSLTPACTTLSLNRTTAPLLCCAAPLAFEHAPALESSSPAHLVGLQFGCEACSVRYVFFSPVRTRTLCFFFLSSRTYDAPFPHPLAYITPSPQSCYIPLSRRAAVLSSMTPHSLCPCPPRLFVAALFLTQPSFLLPVPLPPFTNPHLVDI